MAATQGHLGRFNQIEQSIGNAKVELAAFGEANRGVRCTNPATQSAHGSATAKFSAVKSVKFGTSLPRIARVEEAIELRVVEDQRLSELIMGVRNQIGGLAKEIEERTRQIPFLAEQRTSDTKRIAQLQQETVELFKRTEAIAGRLPLFEEGIRKNQAEYEKLPPMVDALRNRQIEFMEKTRAMVVDREQVLARAGKRPLKSRKPLWLSRMNGCRALPNRSM